MNMKDDIIFSEKMRFEEHRFEEFSAYFIRKISSSPHVSEMKNIRRDIGLVEGASEMEEIFDFSKQINRDDPNVFSLLVYLQGNYFAIQAKQPRNALAYYLIGEALLGPRLSFAQYFLNNRGYTYTCLNKNEDAINDFSSAIKLNKGYSNAYFGRAYAYAQLENFDETIADYTACVNLNDNDYEALNNRGAARYLSGNLIGAKDDFSLAIARSGDSYANAFFNLAQAHNRLFEIKEAIQNFDQAIDLEPSNDIFYFGRGLFHLDEKHSNDEQAYIDFETALQLNPDKKNTYIIKRNQAKLKLGNKEPPTVKIIPTDKDAQIRLLREDLQALQNTIENSKKKNKANDNTEDTKESISLAEFEILKESIELLKQELALLKVVDQPEKQPIEQEPDEDDVFGSGAIPPKNLLSPEALARRTKRFDGLIRARKFPEALEVAKEGLVEDYQNPTIRKQLEKVFNRLDYDEGECRNAWHEILINHLEIDYLTPRMYAEMSRQAYESKPTLDAENWHILKKIEKEESGYGGVAFINYVDKVIVIAHRGTEFEKMNDIRTDLNLFLIDKIPDQVNDAMTFSNEMSQRNEHYRIEHTGHSLGAVLAEVCAWFSKTAAVTFDSPGSKVLIERIRSERLGEHDAIDPTDCRIRTYVSGPNPINTMAPHVGQLVRVFPHVPRFQSEPLGKLGEFIVWGIKHAILTGEIKEAVKGEEQAIYDLMNELGHYINYQHGIKGFIDLFDSDTGQLARDAKSEEVIKWPVGFDKFAHYYQLILKYKDKFERYNYNPNAIDMQRADKTELKKEDTIGYQTKENNEQRLFLSELGDDAQNYLTEYQTTKENPKDLSPEVLNNFEVQEKDIKLTGELNAYEFRLYLRNHFSDAGLKLNPSEDIDTWQDCFDFGSGVFEGGVAAFSIPEVEKSKTSSATRLRPSWSTYLSFITSVSRCFDQSIQLLPNNWYSASEEKSSTVENESAEIKSTETQEREKDNNSDFMEPPKLTKNQAEETTEVPPSESILNNVGQTVKSACKTFLEVPECTLEEFIESAKFDPPIIKPTSTEQLARHVAQTQHTTLTEKFIIGQWIVHQGKKYSTYTFPWNQLRDLTQNDKADLEAAKKQLLQCENNFKQQQVSKAGRSGLFEDRFDHVEKTIKLVRRQINSATKWNEISDTKLKEIQSQIESVQRSICYISERNKELHRINIQEKRLQKSNAKTGKDDGLEISHNTTTGKLSCKSVSGLLETATSFFGLPSKEFDLSHIYSVAAEAKNASNIHIPQQALSSRSGKCLPR